MFSKDNVNLLKQLLNIKCAGWKIQCLLINIKIGKITRLSCPCPTILVLRAGYSVLELYYRRLNMHVIQFELLLILSWHYKNDPINERIIYYVIVKRPATPGPTSRRLTLQHTATQRPAPRRWGLIKIIIINIIYKGY